VFVGFGITVPLEILLAALVNYFFDVQISLPNLLWITFVSIIAGGIVMSFASKIVITPLTKLSTAMTKVAQGDFETQIETESRLEAIQDIYTNFNLMVRELNATETLQTDFVSNVSHELKTPLAVLQNYGVLLEEPNLSEEKRVEYAQAINRVTRHLSELITNILKLNKLEAQKLHPILKNCNLSEMLCECLIGFESEWERKNIEIDFNIEEDVYINTDPEMLILVWANLFSNALKFTPDGGNVSVRLKKDGNYVSVSVSDTGCGMDKITMEHIFEKFYQGDTSHSEKGNGLGLALVKRVIDMLGGEITVESAPDAGSIFTVKLKAD
jgi:signal transduction histidine kinase